jgi:hypothetical protein
MAADLTLVGNDSFTLPSPTTPGMVMSESPTIVAIVDTTNVNLFLPMESPGGGSSGPPPRPTSGFLYPRGDY